MIDMTKRAPRRFMLATGSVMVGLALAGYANVADDLRHVGELGGVTALLLSGLALIGDALHFMARWLALRWVAVGMLSGAVAGTALDATLAGFCLGLAAGIVLAQFRAQSREPA